MKAPGPRVLRLGGPRVRRALVAGAMVLGIVNIGAGTSYAVQFCNFTPIIGNSASGTPPFLSSPYPSTINVTGLTGTITDVNVTLLDVTTRPDPNGLHRPEDADVMLVAPDSSNAIIMTDAGGDNNIPSSNPVNAVDLTLDDQAANQLPGDTALTSGTWRTRDDHDANPQFAPDDQWPAPAPKGSESDLLSFFNGRNPNGTWSLYVTDDQNLAAVDINGGWCIDILTTGNPTTTSTSTSTTVSTSTSTSTTVPVPVPATCDGATATIVGTAGPDTIIGTSGNDVISAGAGNDTISGSGGDDVICGGGGNDRLRGDAGNDRLFGDAGGDQLFGDEGNDTLNGGTDPDQCYRGPTDTVATCEQVIPVAS